MIRWLICFSDLLLRCSPGRLIDFSDLLLRRLPGSLIDFSGEIFVVSVHFLLSPHRDGDFSDLFLTIRFLALYLSKLFFVIIWRNCYWSSSFVLRFGLRLLDLRSIIAAFLRISRIDFCVLRSSFSFPEVRVLLALLPAPEFLNLQNQKLRSCSTAFLCQKFLKLSALQRLNLEFLDLDESDLDRLSVKNNLSFLDGSFPRPVASTEAAKVFATFLMVLSHDSRWCRHISRRFNGERTSSWLLSESIWRLVDWIWVVLLAFIQIWMLGASFSGYDLCSCLLIASFVWLSFWLWCWNIDFLISWLSSRMHTNCSTDCPSPNRFVCCNWMLLFDCNFLSKFGM